MGIQNFTKGLWPVVNIFLNVIVPVLVVAAAGAGLQRWKKLSAAPFGHMMLYLLSPALVLDSLANAEMPLMASGRIVLGVLLMSVVLVAICVSLSRILGHGRSMQGAFLLTTLFPNVGNMGLPIALLAFGEQGLAVAVMIYAAQAIIGWSLGVYVAARSHPGGFSPLKQTLRLPVLWAIAAALLLRATGTELPAALAKPIHMLGQASVPVMLLILGFQLEKGVALDRWPSLVAALAVRLIGSAFIAYLVGAALGLEGVTQQTFIVVSAMPAAVFITIIATEFQTEPRFVSSVVIASTLLSFVSLTMLVAFLQGGRRYSRRAAEFFQGEVERGRP